MSSVDFTIDAASRLGIPSTISPSAVEQIAEVLDQISEQIQGVIFSAWPVDTGRSLRAWQVFSEGLVLFVRNPVEYVSWVNKGTSAELIELRLEEFWRTASGEILAIVSADLAAQAAARAGAQAAAGTLGGDVAGALAARTLIRAGFEAAGVTSPTVFEELRGAFSISRITQREGARRRGR